jgi:hypothetical protein
VEIELFGVALLFGVCGGLSSVLVDAEKRGGLLPVVVFALLSAVLFLRSRKKILAAPLIVAVFPVAGISATAMGLGLGVLYPLGACFGGLVGGMGVTLATSIGYPRLRSRRYLMGGGAIGCLAALPFSMWLYLQSKDSNDAYLWLHISFAIWQAAVGTYLYAVCAHVEKSHHRHRR